MIYRRQAMSGPDVNLRGDLSMIGDESMPTTIQPPQVAPMQGKESPWRSDFYGLVVLLVGVVIFLTVSLRWGSHLWQVLDGQPMPKESAWRQERVSP